MFLLTILAFYFRWRNLGEESLWLDESLAVSFAKHELSQIAGILIRRDTHPPGYSWLLHFWMTWFGRKEIAVRSLSAIFGSLSIPMTYFLGRQLFSPSTALTAATLSAISPFHLFYSQEARSYSLFGFALIVAFWAYLKWLKQTNSKNALLCFGAMAALPYIHVFGIFALLSINLHYLYARTWGNADATLDRTWIAGQLLVLVFFFPWIKPLFNQMQHASLYAWIPPPTWTSVRQLLWDYGGENRLLTCAMLGLTAVGCCLANSMARIGLLTVGMWMLLPPVLSLMISAAYRPIFVSRYFMQSFLFFPFFAAVGLESLARGKAGNWLKNATLILLLALPLRATSAHQKEEWRQVAQWITPQLRSEDTILIDAKYCSTPFCFYTEPKVAIWNLQQLKQRSISGGPPIGRIWAILSHTSLNLKQIAERFPNYVLAAHRSFVGIDAGLFLKR